jgi:flagellar basal-body rod protein FlgC
MKAMEISLSGLDVEWRRLEVIANNLANANTVQTPDGGPYRAMRLISGPKTSFEGHLGNGTSDLDGVAVYGLAPTDAPPRKVHEPGNPAADADGNVSYPGIDHAAEMVLMVKTSRAYEANLVAMNAAREMYVKSLDMGRG